MGQRNRDGEADYIGEPSYDIADALRLALLFHSGSPWDAAKQAEWLRIAGTREASTKVLCDHIRSALSDYRERPAPAREAGQSERN